mmetsp:Transcript_5483/g.8360  ORF Transcript_5483/g.8360 Transcript_5483/m.8360 type:complete len:187 (-) Transcript_5483:231-791(-)
MRSISSSTSSPFCPSVLLGEEARFGSSGPAEEINVSRDIGYFNVFKGLSLQCLEKEEGEPHLEGAEAILAGRVEGPRWSEPDEGEPQKGVHSGFGRRGTGECNDGPSVSSPNSFSDVFASLVLFSSSHLKSVRIKFTGSAIDDAGRFRLKFLSGVIVQEDRLWSPNGDICDFILITFEFNAFLGKA